MPTDISAKIGVEGAQKAVSDLTRINQALTQNTNAVRQVVAQYGEYTEKEERSNKLNELTAQRLELLKEKREELSKAIAESTEKYGAESTQANRLSKSLAATSVEIYKLESGEANIIETTEDAAGSFDLAKEKAESLAGALAATGLVEAVKQTGEALAECAKSSIEFETAVTGVYKTVDGSDEQLKELTEDIKRLSTEIPKSTTEIAHVAQAAGQLGIATDDIMAFSEVMLALGVSTNLSAEEAASSLAKFANITGTASGEYEKLGSTIVELGNNFATTEADIVEMSLRLASAGTLVGMAETDILALATAMSSVGIQAEAGGTAMTKTITAIENAVQRGGEKLEQFADVSGLSAQEFSEMWNGSPIEAIEAFIAGLGSLEERGENATLVLDDMGLNAIRQGNMLKSLSLASEKLTNAIDMSNSAWAENTALAKESGLFYGTTEGKLERAANSFNNLKIAVGDVFTPVLGTLAEAASSALSGLTSFVENNEFLVIGATAAAASVGILAAGVMGLPALFGLAAKAVAAFTVAMNAHPILLAVSAISAAATAIVLFSASARESVPTVKELTEETRNLKEAAEQAEKTYNDTLAATLVSERLTKNYISTLADLEEGWKGTEAESKKYNQTVELLKSQMPGLNVQLDEQTGLVVGGAAALERQAELWAENARAQAQAAAEAAKLEAYYAAQIEHEANVAALADTQERLKATTEALILAQEEEGRAVTDANVSFDDAAARVLELEEEQRMLLATEAAYTEAVRVSGEALGEYGYILEVVDGSVSALNETQSDTYGFETMSYSAEQLVADLQKLESEYNEAYEAAKESLDGQFNWWESAPETVSASVDEIIGNLNDHTAYMNEYADLLTEAADRGVNKGFLATLDASDPMSRAILESLVNGADGKITEFNEAFERTEEAKDSLARNMADAVTDFTNKMNAMQRILENMPDEFNYSAETYMSGRDTIQGYINGINSKSGSLYTRMKQIAQNALAYFQLGVNNSSSRPPYYYGDRGAYVADAAGSVSIYSGLGEAATYSGYSDAQKYADAFSVGLIDAFNIPDQTTYLNQIATYTPSVLMPSISGQIGSAFIDAAVRNNGGINVSLSDLDKIELANIFADVVRSVKGIVVLDDKEVGDFVIDTVAREVYA